MIDARSVAELRSALAAARVRGSRIGLVPTMGYLHDGHLALCDAARERADLVVLSIFVNPLQFGPGEDLARYPRDLVRDAKLARSRGIDLLFVPDMEEVYPDGETRVRVHAPDLADRLCGAFRPGHFEGVLTIVAKLFNMVQPHVAVFGQKDLQQSVLVRRMVRDLDFAIDIHVAPIVREQDGLALSSRNVYLSPDEREAATSLARALAAAQQAFSAGERSPASLCSVATGVLAAQPLVRVQYVQVVSTDTLETPQDARSGDAIAVAAFVGNTRLIDNQLLT